MCTPVAIRRARIPPSHAAERLVLRRVCVDDQSHAMAGGETIGAARAESRGDGFERCKPCRLRAGPDATTPELARAFLPGDLWQGQSAHGGGRAAYSAWRRRLSHRPRL